MNKTLLNIYETILLEASVKDEMNMFFSQLNIENGNVKLYHYSNIPIKDKFISIRGKQGLQSRSEYQEWGKDRAFFYGKQSGVAYDKGVGSDYLYVSHISANKIYLIHVNPNNYKTKPGEHNLQSKYEQAIKDGYVAFGYYLGGNKKVPIIVSFINLPIDEAYEKGPSGEYIPLGKKLLDYRIGTVIVNGDNYIIMQKAGYIKSLSNTYLTQEHNPKKAMGSYKQNFEAYMWKDAKLDPEYQNEPMYKKEMKKYK